MQVYVLVFDMGNLDTFQVRVNNLAVSKRSSILFNVKTFVSSPLFFLSIVARSENKSCRASRIAILALWLLVINSI
jgi:hypothetical protein